MAGEVVLSVPAFVHTRVLSDLVGVPLSHDGIFYGWRLYLKRPYKRFLVIYIYESPLLCRPADDWRNCHRLSATVDFMAVKI